MWPFFFHHSRHHVQKTRTPKHRILPAHKHTKASGTYKKIKNPILQKKEQKKT